jgi:hypothetical protein
VQLDAVYLIVGLTTRQGYPRGLELFGVAHDEDEARKKAEVVVQTQTASSYLTEGRPRVLKVHCEEVPL